jgi:hypothetical protein
MDGLGADRHGARAEFFPHAPREVGTIIGEAERKRLISKLGIGWPIIRRPIDKKCIGQANAKINIAIEPDVGHRPQVGVAVEQAVDDGVEVAVGLALIVALYRKRQSAHVEDLTSMKL